MTSLLSRLVRTIGDTNLLRENGASFAQILATIDDPAMEIVSFDVFDTLLTRPVLEPSDLFVLTEPAWCQKGFPGDFVALRLQAERIARMKMQQSTHPVEEPTLDAIYDALAEITALPTGAMDAIQRAELDNERRSLSPRATIRAIYNYAIEKGKRIVAVSDTYAPHDFVLSVLRSNGFTSIERLYVSSEIGRCKATGKLFPLVLRDLDAPAAKVLHIGDNRRSDFLRPREAGLHAFHLPSAVSTYFRHSPFAIHWACSDKPLTPDARLLLGLIINTCFDTTDPASWNLIPHLDRDPRILGYSYLGPQLLLSKQADQLRDNSPACRWARTIAAFETDSTHTKEIQSAAQDFISDADALLNGRPGDLEGLKTLTETLFRTLTWTSARDKDFALPLIAPAPMRAAKPIPLVARRLDLMLLRPLLQTRKYIQLVMDRKKFFATTKSPFLRCYAKLTGLLPHLNTRGLRETSHSRWG